MVQFEMINCLRALSPFVIVIAFKALACDLPIHHFAVEEAGPTLSSDHVEVRFFSTFVSAEFPLWKSFAKFLISTAVWRNYWQLVASVEGVLVGRKGRRRLSFETRIKPSTATRYN